MRNRRRIIVSDNFNEAEELNECLGDAAEALRTAHSRIMEMLFEPKKCDKNKNNIVPSEKIEK